MTDSVYKTSSEEGEVSTSALGAIDQMEPLLAEAAAYSAALGLLSETPGADVSHIAVIAQDLDRRITMLKSLRVEAFTLIVGRRA